MYPRNSRRCRSVPPSGSGADTPARREVHGPVGTSEADSSGTRVGGGAGDGGSTVIPDTIIELAHSHLPTPNVTR